jgi:hypothetical protein
MENITTISHSPSSVAIEGNVFIRLFKFIYVLNLNHIILTNDLELSCRSNYVNHKTLEGLIQSFIDSSLAGVRDERMGFNSSRQTITLERFVKDSKKSAS